MNQPLGPPTFEMMDREHALTIPAEHEAPEHEACEACEAAATDA